MTAQEAPYPDDTLSKGWRFELHTEKIKKSDTWLRARTGFVRAHLLLLWSEAWEQTPCGTLPNDDELVALILDMDMPTFLSNKAVLMRGWVVGGNGRLYHETITERVLAMLEKRDGDAKRSASRRARILESRGNHEEVTPASRVTSTGLTHESTVSSPPSTKHQNQIPDKEKKEAKASSAAFAPPEWVPAEQWADFVKMRKAMRGVPFTEAAAKGVVAELARVMTASGCTAEQLLQTAVTNGWRTVYPPKSNAPIAVRASTGKHAGFQNLDYRDGVDDDGTFT